MEQDHGNSGEHTFRIVHRIMAVQNVIVAFMKGALTGNAAQVLWDTNRETTGTLRKLAAMLKSRYSGECQAEKHRTELQIRQWKPSESLSERHQDIRRLMALAYLKLKAETCEEIASDHFTNALNDPHFALKVKESAPTSLDEALRIALRLEAWTKSIKLSKHEEDHKDCTKQKARAVGNQDGPVTGSLAVRPQSGHTPHLLPTFAICVL